MVKGSAVGEPPQPEKGLVARSEPERIEAVPLSDALNGELSTAVRPSEGGVVPA